MDAFPWFDAGVVIVVFTVFVKFALYPLSRKATVAQIEMKKIEPELNKIKEKHKDDKQEQARQTMALYKDRKINPFGSLLPIFIQLPIIFALYFVFLRSGLPQINEDLLYSFVSRPENIDMNFLGLVNITGKSFTLALLAAVSSFFQMKFSLASQTIPPKDASAKPSFQNDFARSMNLQMKYFFPIIVFFISYKISGVVALYWLTSNLFTIGQEFYVRRKLVAVNN
jgi:YidC/Oxa1 family membrane protein insertase